MRWHDKCARVDNKQRRTLLGMRAMRLGAVRHLVTGPSSQGEFSAIGQLSMQLACQAK